MLFLIFFLNAVRITFAMPEEFTEYAEIPGEIAEIEIVPEEIEETAEEPELPEDTAETEEPSEETSEEPAEDMEIPEEPKEEVHDENEPEEIAEIAAETEKIEIANEIPVFTFASVDQYTETIDLSDIPGGNGTYAGYKVEGLVYNKLLPAWPAINADNGLTGHLTFKTGAEGNVYHIVQTGKLNNPYVGNSPHTTGPHYGTSLFVEIVVETNIDITLVISDIDLIGSIILKGTAKLTLVLDGENYVRENIIVPSEAEITIGNLTDDTRDRLIMTSLANSRSNDAKIGSRGGGRAGAININGGKIDIAVRSTGAGIGGGGGSAGDGGNIKITGGDIYVMQYGSGDDSGTGLGGACIGGGGSNNDVSHSGAGAGNLLITGGTVTVRQRARGAAIGGGAYGPAGNITIEGGNIDAEQIRLVDSSGAGDGAAIGNGAGTNYGTGNITISGGTVRAVGVRMGIGRVHADQNYQTLSITITGGEVYAKTKNENGGISGPAIGYWSQSFGSTITITGGIVVAESAESTAIGCTLDNNTKLNLDTGANVRAYAGGTWPAINTQDNLGNGYYVNASFTGTNSPFPAAAALNAFDENTGILVKRLTLPANYRHFAYSTGFNDTRTDNIFAQNGAAVTGTVMRDKDDAMQIYSVKTRGGYNGHNNHINTGIANNAHIGLNSGTLPVKFISGNYYTIIEKHVDIYGSPIVGINDNTAIISSGSNYIKPITEIEGHEIIGYFVGGTYNPATDTYQRENTAVISNVTADKTVYFIYEKIISGTSLTITDKVEGPHSNKFKEFIYNIYFEDNSHNKLPQGTEFYYTGDIIDGPDVIPPPNGILILDGDGKAEISLMHGQSITIEGVEVDGRICITVAEVIADGTICVVGEGYSRHKAFFTDSESNLGDEPGADTKFRQMTVNPRVFDFVIERITVPATEVDVGYVGNVVILFISVIMLGTIYLTIKTAYRRRLKI